MQAIYKIETDLEAANPGLYRGDTPKLEIGPGSPSKDPGLDSLSAAPLDQKTRDLIAQTWAVAQGAPDEICDVFQSFSMRDTETRATFATHTFKTALKDAGISGFHFMETTRALQ